MTFRARLLLAFALATIIPLAMLMFGVRRKLTERLVAQKEQRIEALRQVAAQDIGREARSIASRLATLAATPANAPTCSTGPATQCAPPASTCSSCRTAPGES